MEHSPAVSQRSVVCEVRNPNTHANRVLFMTDMTFICALTIVTLNNGKIQVYHQMIPVHQTLHHKLPAAAITWRQGKSNKAGESTCKVDGKRMQWYINLTVRLMAKLMIACEQQCNANTPYNRETIHTTGTAILTQSLDRFC